MSIKFTKSRDGSLRASINIQHRIGADDLIKIASYLLDRKEKITKKSIEEELRGFLHSTGSDYYELAAVDDASHAHYEEAQEYVMKLYPELYG